MDDATKALGDVTRATSITDIVTERRITKLETEMLFIKALGAGLLLLIITILAALVLKI